MKRISMTELDEIIRSMFNNQQSYLEYSPVLWSFVVKISDNYVDRCYTYSAQQILAKLKIISDTWPNVKFNINPQDNTVNIWKDERLVAQVRYISEDSALHGNYILHWFIPGYDDFVFNHQRGKDLDAAYMQILNTLCLGI